MFQSLRARLIGICIAITTAALVVLAFSTFYVVRNNTLAGIDSRLEQRTRLHANEITEWVKEKQRITGSLKIGAAQADPMPFLEATKQAGALDDAYLVHTDKRHAFLHPVPDGYDGTSRGWYKLAMQANGPVIAPAYIGASSGKLLITFAEPWGPSGQRAGVVATDMLLESVGRMVTAIRPTSQSFAVLVDEQGRLLAQADPKLALKPVSDLAAGIDAPLLQRLAANGGRADVPVQGADQMLYAAKVEGTPWTLAIAIDRAEATRPVRDLLQVAALITILCVAVAVG
ncbi:cache domain-containing protein, partial [Acidovorax sp. GBBC 3334]|uniref:cache domain-containing protein n=1 Tax=Acidovorax sp. GBBC 3334 TaxID=2940496 RepID=UPI0023022661